jgi:hypothetical protein
MQDICLHLLSEGLRATLTGLFAIPNEKPPTLLEESQCFTYAEDLPEYGSTDRSITKELFRDDTARVQYELPSRLPINRAAMIR